MRRGDIWQQFFPSKPTVVTEPQMLLTHNQGMRGVPGSCINNILLREAILLSAVAQCTPKLELYYCEDRE